MNYSATSRSVSIKCFWPAEGRSMFALLAQSLLSCSNYLAHQGIILYLFTLVQNRFLLRQHLKPKNIGSPICIGLSE